MIDRRHSTVLYSDPNCLYCHIIRYIIAEKHIQLSIIDVLSEEHKAPMIIDKFGDRGSKPVFVFSVLIDFIEERYPANTSITPFEDLVDRVTTKMIAFKFLDLYETVTIDEFLETLSSQLCHLRKNNHEFIYGNDFTLIDAFLGPILFRIKNQISNDQLQAYLDFLLHRPEFQITLNDSALAAA